MPSNPLLLPRFGGGVVPRSGLSGANTPGSGIGGASPIQ
jgi:hypothetical protein